MGKIDKEILAERIAAVERHLSRVKDCLPASVKDFKFSSSASDSVILHLWQAIQLIIDMALSLCVHLNLGSPTTYAEAFSKLGEAKILKKNLATRLCHAAGFRNRIVHAYEDLDMRKVYKIARKGPDDLKAFLSVLVNYNNSR